MTERSTTLARIRDVGVIPVIRAESQNTAIEIADALIAAGLTIVEVTMTVPHAIEAMVSIARRFGSGVTLGAGTVTSPLVADAAIEAGCRFLVTPCLLPDVVSAARLRATPVICGALTPTEIFAAHESGADLVKVFPAGTAGGPAYIRAIKGPFPAIELVATGGISLESVPEYIQAGVAAVGVGGELISRAAVKARDFQAIGRSGRQFVAAVQEARRA